MSPGKVLEIFLKKGYEPCFRQLARFSPYSYWGPRGSIWSESQSVDGGTLETGVFGEKCLEQNEKCKLNQSFHIWQRPSWTKSYLIRGLTTVAPLLPPPQMTPYLEKARYPRSIAPHPPPPPLTSLLLTRLVVESWDNVPWHRGTLGAN